MYKQLLKSGATALAGFAAKKVLSGFNKSPQDKVKEAIHSFKDIIPIDDEDVIANAKECFEENIFDNDPEDLDEEFRLQYVGSFESNIEAGQFLLAESENSDFINNFDESEAIQMTSSSDNIALAYLDYLMSDDDANLQVFQDEDGVYHLFDEGT